MTSRTFVDTNVFVYAFDADEPAKRAIALGVVRDTPDLVISTQVLGEFFVAVTRKLARPIPVGDAVAAMEELTTLPVVPTDLTLVRSALATARMHQLSYWDALVVEAAATAGCDRLLTEDLADGAELRGVRIENPFAA
ncbi:MAG: PIN domain-containing protein [Ilumatobacter sp.]|nr:MAG: PIN domain-containing protein [Ilumatobacter sp.]